MKQRFSLGGRAERALFGSWLTSVVSFFAVVLPKCPLCVAAYLGLFGVSASSARALIEHGKPLCLTLIAGCTLATALFVARRSQRAPASDEQPSSCCGNFAGSGGAWRDRDRPATRSPINEARE